MSGKKTEKKKTLVTCNYNLLHSPLLSYDVASMIVVKDKSIIIRPLFMTGRSVYGTRGVLRKTSHHFIPETLYCSAVRTSKNQEFLVFYT